MSNATDAAVKLAAEHGIDLADVVGTGADGRITKGDVEAHLANATVEGEAAETAVSPETEDEPETAASVVVDVAPTNVEEVGFLNLVQAADTLQALIALGGQAADEAQRAAVRERAKELLK